MNLSDSVLIESKSARDQGVSTIESQGLQLQILNKVKSAFFALWQGEGYMTTKQVIAYYESTEDAVDKNLLRHRAEFEADGVFCLRAKDDLEGFREARDIMSLASNSSQTNLFPPRAVIRMGFILQESKVAEQVRTAALNLIQGVGHFFEPKVIEALIDGYPILDPFAGSGQLHISAPLVNHYASIEHLLKKRYPDGGIPGMSKQDIREKLAALSTYTDYWKFGSQKEMRYALGSSVCAKYPDLTTQPFNLTVDGQQKTALLMFQLSDLLVDERDVELAVGRQYLKRAVEHCSVDYAFLFLVAPFGATPRAEDAVRQDLPNEMKGFIGVMTVKEVAEILLKQAKAERKANLIKGEVRKAFSDILDYEIPVDPLLLMMNF